MLHVKTGKIVYAKTFFGIASSLTDVKYNFCSWFLLFAFGAEFGDGLTMGKLLPKNYTVFGFDPKS